VIEGAVGGSGSANIPARNPHRSAVCRYIAEHDGTGPDSGIITDGDITENLSPCSNDDVTADGGVALARLLTRAAQGDALVYQGVAADNRRFPDDDAHAVVNEHAGADLRPWVNLDTGKETGQVGNEAGQDGRMVAVQPVGQSVGGESMEARIAEQYFQDVAGRRISLKDDAKVGDERQTEEAIEGSPSR